MTYLPIITAVISGLLVWALGRYNATSDEHKNEKKRLNRLLYNMLELKHWVDKEISAELFVTKYLEKMMVAIKAIDPEKTESELNEMSGLIAAGIKRTIFKQVELSRLEQNISEIVRDYSEIDPFFAYDLTGKYQLTENIELMKTYLEGVTPGAIDMSEANAFINHLLRPTMLADLQRDLITHLPQIAEIIGDEALETVNKNHLGTEAQINEDALENYCQEMIPRLMTTVTTFIDQPR